MPFSWNKTNTYLALLAIFACLLILRLHISDKKQIFAGDESLSFVISSVSSFGWNTLPADGTAMKTTAIKNNTYTVDGGAKELFKDIYHLHLNVLDAPHTNLYYSLLRIAAQGVKSDDVKSLIRRGITLNVILFSASFFCAWWLSGILISKVGIRLLALGTAFIMYPAVYNTLLLRTYQLQELAFLIFTIVFLKNVPLAKATNNCTISYTKLIASASSMAFAFLSGYFAIIYVVLLGFLLITIALLNKNYTYIKYALTSFVAAFVISYSVYASFLVFLYEGNPVTANTTLTNMISSASSTFKLFIDIAAQSIFKPLPLCVLGIFLLYFIARRKSNTQIQGPYISILPAVIVWCFIVLLVTPNKHMGYLLPIVPILIITIYMLIDAVKMHGFLFSIILTLSIVSTHTPALINVAAPAITPEKQDSAIIFSLKLPWTLAGTIQYYDADNTIIFKNTCETLAESILNKQSNLYVIDDEMYASCPNLPHEAITFERNLYYSKAFVLNK